jgi:hypothetical protein
VCVTVGSIPGDASTAMRSGRRGDLPLTGTVREGPVPRTTARAALRRATVDAAPAA